MKDKPYMKTSESWMAHNVMKINNECIESGKFINGKKVTEKERIEMIIENIECQLLLINKGVMNNQLKLF